jgi:hypothetical protein
MIPRLLALALALAISVLAGCSPASKLHGKWDLETADPEPPPMGGAYIPSAVTGFMKLKMNLEFQPDGDLIVEARAAGESETSRGKWSHVKTEGDVTTVKIAVDGHEEREVDIHFVDRKTIETVVPPVGEDGYWNEEKHTFTRRAF